jgi:hypothetical protein
LSEDLLEKLESLIQNSARNRTSFLLAVTISSRSISRGADDWFRSEVDLLEKEMNILKEVMPEEVAGWKNTLTAISHRFKRAISFLNDIISKAERGEIDSISQVHVPKPQTLVPEPFIPLPEFPQKQDDKSLDLVSAILEVFDSASNLEKLIGEVERESMRTVNTARLVIKALKKGK